MGRIELGDITKHNIKLLRRLNQTIFPVNYNEKFYKDVLESGQLAKLAFFNDVVVGVVCCRLDLADNGKHLYIMTLGCLFTYRRLGVGTTMLKHVIDHASKKGVDDIYLHVQSSNNGAIEFYKKFGFEIVGVKEDYYKRIEPSSALVLKKVMQKNLSS
jgi:ribosomal protein S18 acetylase RimI-like enzyme